MNKTDFELIVSLRHELHAHPELSEHEYETKARLMSFLAEHTALKIVDRGAWFYAYYSSENPELAPIAFRADFDAVGVTEANPTLPYRSCNEGVGHMCGHDGHSAALCAFALELSRLRLNRDVYLIFQHAEENGQGAKLCSELIDEKGIAEIFAFHNCPGRPLGEVSVRKGCMDFASRGMILSFLGKQAHASRPEDGVNPAMAIAELIPELDKIAAASSIEGLCMCTIVMIELGEETFGISAGSGRLLLTIRGEYESELDKLDIGVKTTAAIIARDENVELRMEYRDVFPETGCTPQSVDKLERLCHRLDIPFYELPEPQRGSEDFGWYTKRTHGAIFNIGSGRDHAGLHTESFDYPDEITPIAVRLMLGLTEN